MNISNWLFLPLGWFCYAVLLAWQWFCLCGSPVDLDVLDTLELGPARQVPICSWAGRMEQGRARDLAGGVTTRPRRADAVPSPCCAGDMPASLTQSPCLLSLFVVQTESSSRWQPKLTATRLKSYNEGTKKFYMTRVFSSSTIPKKIGF